MPTPTTIRYIPNALTIGRIALTPLVLLLLSWPTLTGQAGALVLFIVASASDYLDGWLARSYGARSRLGKFLDPLADKVLVLGTFIMLAAMYPAVVPWWAVLLIAVRDVVVTGLRTRAEAAGRSIRTLPLAKSKTMAQLAYLVGMLALLTATYVPGAVQEPARWILHETAWPVALLMLVVALTLLTGALYFFPQRAALLQQRLFPQAPPAKRNSPRSKG